MEILEGLNDRQRAAAEYLNGPLLILAGAGSGKTRTIITRIAHILEEGYAWPSQILAITFTNKAASEMRERIAAMDIPETEKIWMSTFHSACAKILRMHGDLLGYSKHFKIIDTDDQRTLIKKYLKQYNIDPKTNPPAKVASIISKCKNDGTTPEELHDIGRTDVDRKIAMIFKDYQKDLKRYDSMDFDDLLLKTIELFKTHPEVLKYFQKKFKYILVDEYQDTNAVQYELVQMLAQGYRNLCVCGDDDQSIVRLYRYGRCAA